MGKDTATLVVTNKKPGILRSPLTVIRRVYSNRRLVKHLIMRDLKVTYHGTFIGWGWTMVEPLALTAVYWLVFSLLRGNDDYLFVLEILLGVLAYGMFSQIFSRTTTAIVGNSGLIKQVAIPREVFLWSIGGFQVLRFFLSTLIIPPLLFAMNMQINPMTQPPFSNCFGKIRILIAQYPLHKAANTRKSSILSESSLTELIIETFLNCESWTSVSLSWSFLRVFPSVNMVVSF